MKLRRLLNNKRGSEMTIGTIIVIILALVVLIFLVFGFSTGWTNLWDKIKNLFLGGPNVDTIVQACSASCASQAAYGYCSQVRDMRLDDTTTVRGSCATFAANIGRAGVASCAVDCSSYTLKKCSDLGGTWAASCTGTQDDSSSKVENSESETNNLRTMKCCTAKAAAPAATTTTH